MEKYVTREDPTALEILQHYFPQVCPKSFFYDQQVGLILDMESAAESYHTLPYNQNYMDNPHQITEGFDLIREVKSKWHQKKVKEMEQKSKASEESQTHRGKR